MAKGFPGVPGNMQAMLKQAQKMQEDLLKAQEEAESLTGEGSSGGGMVKAVVNGKHRLDSLEIDPSVIDPNDKEGLQDLILAAINLAAEDVDGKLKAKMSKITGGMSIPGLF